MIDTPPKRSYLLGEMNSANQVINFENITKKNPFDESPVIFKIVVNQTKERGQPERQNFFTGFFAFFFYKFKK